MIESFEVSKGVKWNDAQKKNRKNAHRKQNLIMGTTGFAATGSALYGNHQLHEAKYARWSGKTAKAMKHANRGALGVAGAVGTVVAGSKLNRKMWKKTGERHRAMKDVEKSATRSAFGVDHS